MKEIIGEPFEINGELQVRNVVDGSILTMFRDDMVRLA